MQTKTPIIDTAAIIGGGIFGVSTAVQLTKMGVSVTLVNDGPPGCGASGRSLSWLNSARRRSAPYHAIRMAGIERYRGLALENPGADWLRFDGGLTWDADKPGNDIAGVYRHERDLGYQADLLSSEEVKDRVPGIASGAVPPQGAILNRGEGWVDLPSLIARLMAEFQTLGGTVVTDAGKVKPLSRDGRVVGVHCPDGREIGVDAVLLATGPAVPAMAAEMGVTIRDETPISLLIETKPVDHPLRAVLNTPRAATRRTPTGAFFLDSGWSEREVIRHDDGSYEAKPETIARLLEELKAILDPVPDLEIARIHMGPKPIPGGGEPVFGALPTVPGCHVAFSHSGATLGLLAGEMIAEEMALGYAHPLLSEFRPGRFS